MGKIIAAPTKINFKVEGGAAASQTGSTCGIIYGQALMQNPIYEKTNNPIVKIKGNLSFFFCKQ